MNQVKPVGEHQGLAVILCFDLVYPDKTAVGAEEIDAVPVHDRSGGLLFLVGINPARRAGSQKLVSLGDQKKLAFREWVAQHFRSGSGVCRNFQPVFRRVIKLICNSNYQHHAANLQGIAV